MRKRYLVIAGVVALLAAGTAVAFAEDTDPATASSANPERSVELPTGDVVELSPRGGFQWHPADGRGDIGYLAPPAADGSGDLITIPADRLAAVVDGTEDPRRYNVSELLRAGETDAAKAKTLSDKEYGQLTPAGTGAPKSSAANQKVDITVTARGGAAVTGAAIAYLNLDTEAMDVIGLDETGHGTVELPPGRYDFSSMTLAGSDAVMGLRTVEVADGPVDITMDGDQSKPVEYKLDRPAELTEQTLHVFTVMKDGVSFGNSITMAPNKTGYLIPNPVDDHKAGIEAIPHLVGTDTAAEPYRYDLNFFHTDGIPTDTVFTAADADLAQVKVDYDGFGNEEPIATCNNSFRDGGLKMIGCQAAPGRWHSSRTEYLTPGSDLKWFSSTHVGAPGAEAIEITGLNTYQAGPAERVVGSAALSFNVAGSRLFPVLTRDGDVLTGSLPFLDNADPNQTITDHHPTKGTAVLERDGEEIARTELTGQSVEFTLPKGDTGRYTLSATSSHAADYTPLATSSAVTWEFTSAPTGTATPLDVSAVGFDAEGVTGGYADASEPQEFTLDFAAQDGATDTKLTELTFEVSYDDGKTWRKVDVDQDGDTATGELEHPAGAKFVSVRATATDDAGNQVTHSTVAAYGLK